MLPKKNVLIVAEISCNHCQKFENAVNLVLAAKQCGADAVKIQMFRPEEMTTGKYVIKEGLWAGKKLLELYEEAATPYEWVPVLKELAEKLGLFFFTSVYGLKTVDIAEDMGIEAYKIASFELPYKDLLKKVAKTKKPVILSIGGSTDSQVWIASRHLYQAGCKDFWLLHCTEYLSDKMNLRTITDLHRRYQGKVGLSDHTKGFVAPVVSVGFGARIIEKHLMLKGTNPLDKEFSLTPIEFKTMVDNVRLAEKAEGVVSYGDGNGPFRRREVNGKMIRTV